MIGDGGEPKLEVDCMAFIGARHGADGDEC